MGMQKINVERFSSFGVFQRKQRPLQQQQQKPPFALFLKPLFVEPTGGGVWHVWDPPDDYDMRDAQLARQQFVDKAGVGLLQRTNAVRRIASVTG